MLVFARIAQMYTLIIWKKKKVLYIQYAQHT